MPEISLAAFRYISSANNIDNKPGAMMNTQVGTPASAAKSRITTSTNPTPSRQQIPKTIVAKTATGMSTPLER